MPELRVDVHLGPGHFLEALRADVRRGLTATPKELPPKWFYDDVGSKLFDEITRLDEYYPTRREREILESRSAEIAGRAAGDTLVELGSGTCEKTEILLGAGDFRRYIPFDVSEGTLRAAGERIARRFGVDVHGVVGDFDHHLHTIPGGGRRLVAFLGGTIGNLAPAPRARFLRDLRATMDDGDSLLLGTDLVKDTARLLRAYDDAAGVTAEFNRNVLRVLNRELDADLQIDAFEHVAVWDESNEWIEMRLRSSEAQEAEIGDLGMRVSFAAGEEMRTEISAKFRPERIDAELAGAGFAMVERWTDDAGDFALTLARA